MFPPGRARLSTKPLADRVGHEPEDDGDRLGRGLGSPRPSRRAGDYQVHLAADQFGSQLRHALDLPFGVGPLEDEVLAFDPPELTKLVEECLRRRVAA